MSVLHEFFLNDGDQAVDPDGLLWKEVLREGESAYTPTPRGPLKRPFKVVRDGASDLANGIVSMSELVESHESGAYENVQVILATKAKQPDGTGGDHDEITANNTGYVRQLKIIDGDDGSKLYAGVEFTEPEVREKCERGTFAGCSAGIVGEVVNKHTGGEFRTAMKHMSITNTPWRGGMEKEWRKALLADDEIDEAVGYELAESDGDGSGDILAQILGAAAGSGSEADAGDVVWDERDSTEWLRTKVNGELQNLSKESPDPRQRVFFWVRDVAPKKNTALVVQDSAGDGAGDTFVVPFEVDGDDVSIAPGARWTKTKQVMVAASDELTDDQLKQRIQNALGHQLHLGDDYVVKEVGKEDATVENTVSSTTFAVGWDLSAGQVWLDPTEEWRRAEGSPAPREPKEEKEGTATAELSDQDADTPEGRLQAARRERGLLDIKSNDRGGHKSMKKLNLDGLDLSDEQRAQIEAQFADDEADAQELERLRQKDREREVDDKIDGLKEVGLSDNPGVLKFLRRIYLSDDGKPSAILLADDDAGLKQEEVSLSDAFDQFLDLLKNQEGKLELSSQAVNTGGKRPPEDASEENRSHEEDMAEAAKVLGLPYDKPIHNR